MVRISRKRIALVVENDAATRDAVAKQLDDMKFDVVTANDVIAALRLLEQVTPDILIVDLTLPRESGLDLCDQVRTQSRFAHVQILVISDRHSPTDMANAEDAGANAFLRKPFTPERLSKYVTALLEGPHSSRPSVRRLRRSDAPPPPKDD